MLQVRNKSRMFHIGQQEAETEVIIDNLIEKYGGKDKALLHVCSKVITEAKVCY